MCLKINLQPFVFPLTCFHYSIFHSLSCSTNVSPPKYHRIYHLLALYGHHSSCRHFHPFQFSPFVTGDRATNRPFTGSNVSNLSPAFNFLHSLNSEDRKSSSSRKSEIKPLVAGGNVSCIL